MSKHNGKRIEEPASTLIFARPTKDARGQTITELHSAEGVQWKLTTVPLMVPTGRAKKTASPILVGGQAAVEPEVAPIFIPVWEIVQVVGKRARVWTVPVELAFMVESRELVEVRDATGAVVERRVMPLEEAAKYHAEQERRVAVERGDAEVR
jgi:hypothetical protein